MLIRISSGYSPDRGRLHTRYAPVRHSSASEDLLPFDLHVLGLPLAFILSQDQTLHCKIIWFFLNSFLIERGVHVHLISSFQYFKELFYYFFGRQMYKHFWHHQHSWKTFFSNPLNQNLFQPKGRQIYNNFNSQSACLSKFFLTPLNSFIVYPYQSFLRTSPFSQTGRQM